MKKILMVAALAAMVAGAAPVVEITSVQQEYPWTNTVDITYTSTGITEENTYYVIFKAQDASGNEIGVVTNDLKVSQGSTWVAQWQPPFNVRYENCTMTPYVYKGGMDDYMIVDLETWQVTYELMSEQDASNKKYNTSDYKTKKLVLRKVEAGTYTIGDNSASWDTQHDVSIGKDFYIGIFEVTEGQYNRMLGNNTGYSSMLPVSNISWITFRGNSGVNSAPSAGAALALNNKTNMQFDLPTASMWEVAARANTAGNYVNGSTSATMLKRYAVFGASAKANVGSKDPNAWGIYDVTGNVHEWCRDYAYNGDLKTAQTDGLVAISNGKSSYRVVRGGYYGDNYELAWNTALSFRQEIASNNLHNGWGFRIAYIKQ